MTIKNETPSGTAHAVDVEQLRSQIERLVDEVASATMGTADLQRALVAGMDDIAALLRAVPVAEGRLLERGIGLIAKFNPELVVLSENLRLPVTKAAAELVAMNDAALTKALSLDADSGGRKSYTPDLLILNRSTRIAHLVDVKRSLGSYEVSRIAELKNRMLAAALVVPDLLYKEHRRLHVDEVRVVILNAENQRTDIEGGVWPLTHLDHLLEVEGAGEAMMHLRELFRRRVEENWLAALNAHSADIRPVNPDTQTESTGDVSSSARGADAVPQVLRVPVSIGFARPPRLASA